MSNATGWLTDQNKPVSEFGSRVAELVGELYRGIYHVDDHALKADWSHPRHVDLTVRDESFSTHDSDNLTRLVILAHKYNVRASVKAATHGYLKLSFCEVNKLGFFRETHPSLDELSAAIAKEVPR